MNIYLQLFSTFFKIGAFTIGGGYVMIPIIKREVVDVHKWMDEQEFLDVLTISQSAPGIMAINLSIFIGYKLQGKKGSVVAALGTALPSFLIILIIAMFFTSFRENEYVEKAFKGIRPAVVALIAVPLINMSKAAKLNLITGFVPVISILLITFLDISPIYILMAGAICGVLYFRWYRYKKV